MDRRKQHVRLVVAAVFAVAAGGLIAAAMQSAAPDAHDLAAASLLAPMIAGARLFPLHIAYRRKLVVNSAPLFAAALLLPPFLAALVAGGSMAGAEWARKGPGFRNVKQTVFNASQALIAVLAGCVVFDVVGGGQPLASAEARVFWSVPLAAAAMFVLYDALLLAVVTAQLGNAVLRDWFRNRADIPPDLALYASGFAVALAGSYYLWFLPLLVFPVVVFYRGMRDHVTLRIQTREAVEALADVVDIRNPYTFEHSIRVAAHSRSICGQLGFSEDLTDEIVSAARVHDVGKVGVRDAVLLKPGRLTDDEFAEIQQHPDIGARLTARFPDFRPGTGYIRHHHERWNGTGYPLKLKGEDIPLGARIIAVADTYDAITSTRVYRAALSEEFAREEMVRAAGTQLDPAIVRAFFRYKGWEGFEAEPAPERGLTSAPVPVAAA